MDSQIFEKKALIQLEKRNWTDAEMYKFLISKVKEFSIFEEEYLPLKSQIEGAVDTIKKRIHEFEIDGKFLIPIQSEHLKKF